MILAERSVTFRQEYSHPVLFLLRMCLSFMNCNLYEGVHLLLNSFYLSVFSQFTVFVVSVADDVSLCLTVYFLCSTCMFVFILFIPLMLICNHNHRVDQHLPGSYSSECKSTIVSVLHLPYSLCVCLSCCVLFPDSSISSWSFML